MKTKFPELIIDMLHAAPNGLTSKDIAERPRGGFRLSARLSPRTRGPARSAI
jgi:hypothetical protein